MIAERLGKSVSEAKHSVTATEFLRWVRRFEEEPNEFHWMKGYLAQIAYEVHCLRYFIPFAKPEGPVRKPESFLVKFVKKASTEKQAGHPPVDRDEARRLATIA